MPSTTTLLFDLGGVLVENAGFDRLNALLKTPTDIGALKDRWLASRSMRDFELGRVSPQSFAAAFVDEWGLELTADDFLAEFATWPKGFYPGAAALLDRLRATYVIACLSNSNALHWTRFGSLVDHFDIALSSHLLGVIKPDPECFARAIAECGADAAAIVFFDDSLKNVEAAERAGLRAFHVCGLDEVERVLADEGLLVSSSFSG